MQEKMIKKSRKMSYMLRHNPSEFDIELKKGGWADVPKVLKALSLTMEELKEILSSDNKGRYSLNEDETLVRANQGHSIQVDLGLESIEPPEYLYHGTVQKYMEWIKKEGLKKMSRHHVHLSDNLETATNVASRRNTENVLLKINSRKMFQDGYDFFVSENNVWLTDNVPHKYIETHL